MPDVPLDETSDPESPSPERSFFRPRDVDPQLRPAELAAMSVALDEALLAEAHGDIPVGAVLLSPSRPGDEPEILSRRHNERELTGDPTAHAEMLVLREAAAAAGTWRLEDCTLVVTLEPCPMCAGGALAARVGRVVYGAYDPKAGACGSLFNLASDPRLNHEFEVIGGVRAEDSAALLEAFFKRLRSQDKEKTAAAPGAGT